MNNIQNGDFSAGFDHWHNGVGEDAFVLDAGKAKGASYVASADVKTYNIIQSFSSNEEVVAGKVTVWCKWLATGGNISDGYNRFIVELHKPDTTSVTLLDTTKTDDIDEGYLLNDYDIAAHLDQYGTHWLYLILKTVSAKGVNPDSPPPFGYGMSYSWYDNISIDIVVKKYKTVHEIIGSSGAILSEAKVSRSEAVGLIEAYSTETFSPTFYSETASESVGLSESYSKILKRIHGEVEVVGLSETIQAKRTQGNLETTYILEDLTQWTEISRVETPWIKRKTVIGG